MKPAEAGHGWIDMAFAPLAVSLLTPALYSLFTFAQEEQKLGGLGEAGARTRAANA